MQIINIDKAPKAVGPYSQGVKHNGVLYLSGMLPINPENGTLVGEDVKTQTEQVFKNINLLLESQNLSLNNAIKATVFLQSMDSFAIVNEVYGTYFGEHRPARSCVEVAALPKGALVEIELLVQIE